MGKDIKRVAELTTSKDAKGSLPAVQEKNPAAVALGRLGGLKGGRARAEKLSPKKRSEIAKRAAQARWSAKIEGEDDA